MTLPNILTFSRFVMSVIVFWLIATGDSLQLTIAEGLFILACITDFFDGWLARRRNQVTTFGRITDPFADKFLVTGCLLFLMERNLTEGFDCGLNGLAVFLIMAREFLVNGIRGYAESQGVAFPAVWLGKFKAVWQFCAIGLLILYMGHGGYFEQGVWVAYDSLLPVLAHFVVWSTVFITLLSAIPYILKASRIFI